MECKQAKNKKDCGCTYPGCPRKGRCCECIRYHREMGELPGCLFPEDEEKTYDRTVENFVRVMKKRLSS